MAIVIAERRDTATFLFTEEARHHSGALAWAKPGIMSKLVEYPVNRVVPALWFHEGSNIERRVAEPVPGSVDMAAFCKKHYPEVAKLVSELLPSGYPDEENGKLAVDIEDLARKAGIKAIEYVPSECTGGKRALLLGKRILVDKEESEEQRRFSIAHEVWHFLTQTGDGWRSAARQTLDWKTANAGTPEGDDEGLASYFAANLLIPVLRYVTVEHETDETIATIFKVPVKCAWKRRKEVNLEIDCLAAMDDSEPAPDTEEDIKRITEILFNAEASGEFDMVRRCACVET